MPAFMTPAWLNRFQRFLPNKISVTLYPIVTGEQYSTGVAYSVARQRPINNDEYVANSLDINENFLLFSLWNNGEATKPKQGDRITYDGINYHVRKVKTTIMGNLFSCFVVKEYVTT